jgi:squalene-hopene/tetraprenyl-beta-curcumene cyclase
MAENRDRLVTRGLEWLENTRNTDGGWGDTPESPSNISTTALCWAAFGITGRNSGAARDAGEWMRRAAGCLEPARLADAIASRYGQDRTFSAPILTVLALAGHVPWRLVSQLPFEVVVLPRAWFRALRLGVVSYALPALIAIGQLRHGREPSRNPLARAARDMAREPALRLLGRVQPASGGFLEATPLTSFVAMSLLAAGRADSPVVAAALRFLEQSVRPDGSWPIDTNLATWVTTLSVNALREMLPPAERAPVRQWLLAQQYRTVHPYTGTAPGGWAWTDLPGGVPDADDTAGALLALHRLCGDDDPEALAAAEAGARWLLELQNSDGGIPTFCRGWGKLPFDRSSADITAHALRVWLAWRGRLKPPLGREVDAASQRAVSFLVRSQRADGAWVPLWFGNQAAFGGENPVYGTSRVLLALGPLGEGCASRGAAWLAGTQNRDGGWGGAEGLPSSIEETALAISGLAAAAPALYAASIRGGAAWLNEATRGGIYTPPEPIGLYFARLWYHEALYPLAFALDALNRLTTS